MIYFNLLMTLCEDLILAYFNSKILNIENKRMYITLCVTLCFLLTYVLNDLLLNNFLLLFFLIFINTIIAMIMKKTKSLYCLIVPSILIAFLLLANTVALFLTVLILQIEVHAVGQSSISIIILSLISRVLFLFCSYQFYKIKNTIGDIELNNIEWIPFCLFTFFLLGTFTVLYESIFYSSIGIETIYTLLIQFSFMVISFFALYFTLLKYHTSNLKLSNELIKSQYSKEIYKKTNDLSYSILNEKHEMFYILLELKRLISENKDQEALKLIERKTKKYRSFNIAHSSNLPLFDYHILSYINILKERGYKINSIVSANNNKLLENQYVINIIKDLLGIFISLIDKNINIEFKLFDQNSYLIFIISVDQIIEPKSIIYSFDSKYIKNHTIKYNDNMTELKILFIHQNF